jgi:hypothetical protein
MLTHDFRTPIPPGTLRISVIWNDHLHKTDLLMVRIPDTIKAFEEFIGVVLSAEDGRCTPEAAKACTEITVSAAQSGDESIVTTSALWRFLFDPAEYAMNTHRLVALHSDYDELGSGYLVDFLGTASFPNSSKSLCRATSLMPLVARRQNGGSCSAFSSAPPCAFVVGAGSSRSLA